MSDLFPEDHVLDDMSQDLTALNKSAGSSSVGSSSDDHAQQDEAPPVSLTK